MGRCACCKKLTTEKGLTFHRFPGNEIERNKWVQNLGRPDWLPAKTAVLCSNHFTSDCFERWWNITRLRKGSVPTIFSRDTLEAHENRDVDQASNKRSKFVDTSRPTTSSSPFASTSRTSCVEGSSSAETIIPTPSPEISTPSCAVSTPKSTRRKQLTPRISWRRELIEHDHRYEDDLRTSQKKLNLIRKKYESSQKQIKALKRRVNNLKTTVYSLKKVASNLSKKKIVSG